MVIHSVKSHSDVASFLAEKIGTYANRAKHVVWLIPGGSGISVAVQVANKLIATHTLLNMITVTLTDERYGPIGHIDSNEAQLYTAGFSLPGATFISVLKGETCKQTTEIFSYALKSAFLRSDYSIGLFGMGTDGHTAGILPNSLAVVSGDIASSYSTETFERITITPHGIGMLNESVIYAYGKEKWPAIATLISQSVPIMEQPAQVFENVSNADLFSDYCPL